MNSAIILSFGLYANIFYVKYLIQNSTTNNIHSVYVSTITSISSESALQNVWV